MSKKSELQSSILVALGITGVGIETACGPCLDYSTTTASACLNVVSTDTTTTTVCLEYSTTTTTTTTTTGPCLDYKTGTTTTGPCLDYKTKPVDTGDTGAPDTGDTTTTVCLDYEISPGQPGGFKGTPSPPGDRADATRRVLDRGVLPSDVAELLRHRLDVYPTR